MADVRCSRVVGVHLPRFLIQRRLREDGSLAHKPVAVVRSQANTDFVVAVSSAALEAEVQAGQTVTQARALCPGLKLVPDDPQGDARALEALAEALLVCCPNVELCGPEGLWGEASASKLFHGEPALLEVVLDRCRALGYRAQAVLADNKFTAMALAVHRPRPGVVAGNMAEALALLPLSVLPLPSPLGWALQAMGLTTVGDFAALPPAGVASRFGTEGALMQRLAQGDDPRPLVPLRPAPPLVETFALEWAAEALEPVLFGLKTVLDRLTARLSGRGLALTRLAVQLSLSPRGETQVVLPLARPTTSARALLDVFRERLKDLSVAAPVAAVTVEALETGPAERIQLKLGERAEVDEALEAVLARLRAGVSEEALFSAAPHAAHRPEAAWKKAAYRPRGGDDEMPGPAEEPSKKKPKKAYVAHLLERQGEPPPGAATPPEGDPLARAGARPTRLMPEPQPVEVELSAAGQLVALRVGAKRHLASSVKGPERLAGEWWRAPYARDYYRAVVSGLGGCWIFRDGRDGRFYLHGYFD